MKNKLLILSAVVAFAGLQPPAKAQTTIIDLGAASSFAVLAGASVTSTGSTTINGDLGVSPGITVTETPVMTVTGARHLNDSSAISAQLALTAAYNDAAGRTATTFLGAAHDFGGSMLAPGIYNGTSSFAITGDLTLDAQNDPDAIWIFQAGSTLNTAVNSRILFINGGQASNVFWQVGSSATFLSSSIFVGNVLALTSITLGTGATVDGRLLARGGTVALDGNTITAPAAIPEPASISMLIAGFLGLVVGARRIRRHYADRSTGC
jgi:hypothetical protein